MKKNTSSENNLKVTTKNMTLEEAEQQVHKLIQERINYRDITQMEFLINNIVRRFNPSQIKKIKEKFERKIVSSNSDPDTALVFRLFKKGIKPTEVIIKTELSSDFVKEAYAEFLELENNVTVTKWFRTAMYRLASEVNADCNDESDVNESLREALDSHHELQKHVFLCGKCRKPIEIRDEVLRDAKAYLISAGWVHLRC